MWPPRRNNRTFSLEKEVIFLKYPPDNDDFYEDSDSDSDIEDHEWTALYFYHASLRKNKPYIEEDHSGHFLPDHASFKTPVYFSRLRCISVQTNGPTPNLDVLVATNSSECLSGLQMGEDSFPDLSILRVQEEQSKEHRVRPFSAKPRVLRKYRLRTDEAACAKEPGTSNTPDLSENSPTDVSENSPTDVSENDAAMALAPEESEEELIKFEDIKWLLPAVEKSPPKPDIMYPYQKLQPLPPSRVRYLMEEDEDYLLWGITDTASGKSDENDPDEKPRSSKKKK